MIWPTNSLDPCVFPRKRTYQSRVALAANIYLYEVFCAVLHVLKSGCQWRMLPEGVPNWVTVDSYFTKWSAPNQSRRMRRKCDSANLSSAAIRRAWVPPQLTRVDQPHRRASEVRAGVSRKHRTEVDAAIRKRPTRTEPNGPQELRFRSIDPAQKYRRPALHLVQPPLGRPSSVRLRIVSYLLPS